MQSSPPSRGTGPGTIDQGRGYRLGAWRGVDIETDSSLLVAVALITIHLGGGILPWWHRNWSTWLTWTIALVASAAFLGSLLVHDLVQLALARTRGIVVRRVTLSLFGGFAQLEHDAASPVAELTSALIGPLTRAAIGVATFVLGAGWVGPALMTAGASGHPATIASALREVGPVPTVLLWLGPINVTLALLNLLPTLPLDGGRALRALLWVLTRDLALATRWTSVIGQGFAALLMAWGGFNLLTGSYLSGSSLVLIGGILGRCTRRNDSRQTLGRVPLERVMRAPVSRVAPELPREHFVRDHWRAASLVEPEPDTERVSK
jgi:Zn-dependent protease